MPPFGETESDQTIRNIVAFVKRLEGMTPEQYRRLGLSAGGGGHHHGPDGHSSDEAAHGSS